jgi:molybdopterin converting factor small subunit
MAGCNQSLKRFTTSKKGNRMSHHITLKLFATLRSYIPPQADHFPIAPGTTVADVIRDLNIPEKDAKLIFINSVRKDRDALLQDGDRLGIFPPVGGG